jgi:hypothetical protein
LSEPNEPTTAEREPEPLAEATPAPDTTPDKSSAVQNTTPFWKRWLGKS